jgi:hypothetical protein
MSFCSFFLKGQDSRSRTNQPGLMKRFRIKESGPKRDLTYDIFKNL